jgi:hypothetical protein
MKPYSKTSTGAFVTGSGRLMALTLTAGSGAAATAVVHDDRAAATGTRVAALAAVAGTSHSMYLGPEGQYYENGLYVTLTGSGAEAIAYVEKH